VKSWNERPVLDDDRRPAEAPRPRCPRYLSLDFWRGVACLMIVVFHASFYVATPAHLKRVSTSGGTMADWAMAGVTWLWAGVPLFFVISGYCISATADSHRRKNAGVGQYFWRRFRRIYPPFWIFLALTALFVWVVEAKIAPGLLSDDRHGFARPWDIAPLQWLGNLTLTETWRPNVVGPASQLFAGHAWTLCYEEQFYAVVGFILLLWPRRFFHLAAVVSLAVLALEMRPERLVPALKVVHRYSTGFFFDGYWLYFAAGIAVYYAINYATRLGQWAVAGGLALMLAWGVRTHIDSRTVSFGFALLLLALHPLDGGLASAAWARPVSWCGTMCYSLYLVHWPVTKAASHLLLNAGIESPAETLLVTVPISIALSIAAAWPFHLLVERRFLNTPKPQPCHVPQRQGVAREAVAT
jgi:peptidoglycan/LPS O-acetylase OafA/YrhL